MSAPMSEQQFAGIRARLEAAPAGPWHVERDEPSLTRFVANDDGTMQIPFGYVGNRTEAEAEFVANAPEDVSALLAEVERLHTELAKYVGHEPTLTEEAAYVRSQHRAEALAEAASAFESVLTNGPLTDAQLDFWWRDGVRTCIDELAKLAGKDTREGESTQPTQGGGPFERVTVLLTPQSSAALARAAQTTGDSKTDTINRALQAYDLMTGEVQAGAQVVIQRDTEAGDPR